MVRERITRFARQRPLRLRGDWRLPISPPRHVRRERRRTPVDRAEHAGAPRRRIRQPVRSLAALREHSARRIRGRSLRSLARRLVLSVADPRTGDWRFASRRRFPAPRKLRRSLPARDRRAGLVADGQRGHVHGRRLGARRSAGDGGRRHQRLHLRGEGRGRLSQASGELRRQPDRQRVRLLRGGGSPPRRQEGDGRSRNLVEHRLRGRFREARDAGRRR